uniref:Uncharacterized protein n=1 Tax=Acrobeloides nanus TaxID=290746 RepID=A0A914DJU5_9BILA
MADWLGHYAHSCYCRGWLRQHEKILNLPWKPNVRRAEKSNAIDIIVSGLGGGLNHEQWSQYFTEHVPPFKPAERAEWLSKLTDVSVSSDAFFPFRDNIDCAKQFGTKYIASPGGSTRDDEIVEACDEHDMVLIHTGLRLFHH